MAATNLSHLHNRQTQLSETMSTLKPKNLKTLQAKLPLGDVKDLFDSTLHSHLHVRTFTGYFHEVQPEKQQWKLNG